MAIDISITTRQSGATAIAKPVARKASQRKPLLRMARWLFKSPIIVDAFIWD